MKTINITLPLNHLNVMYSSHDRWSSLLFHTMTYVYLIYSYVISAWRSIRPVEINQYDMTVATHYDFTMGNDVARDAHCKITMGYDVTSNIHYDITMSNDVAICTYHCITMHNDVCYEHFLLCILCSIPNCVILLWVAWNKNKNKFVFN